jgi:hypothetical protein
VQQSPVQPTKVQQDQPKTSNEEQTPVKVSSIKAKAMAMQGSIPLDRNAPKTIGDIRSRTQTNDNQLPQLAAVQQAQQDKQPVQPAQQVPSPNNQPLPPPVASKPKYMLQPSEQRPETPQKDQKQDIPPWKKELEMKKNAQAMK